jgi:hypothetical protein
MTTREKRKPKKAGRKVGAATKAGRGRGGADAEVSKQKGRRGGKAGIAAGPPVAPPTESVGTAPVAIAGMVLAWEDDPMSSPARQPIQVPVPSLPTGRLGIIIAEPAPPAEIHPPGSSRFRYWVAVEALARGVEFWSGLLPDGTKWATPAGTLMAHLDFGVDLNAYYRRAASRLEFYHSTVGGRTVYSGESPNILCHELGHAVLDSVRPQLFNAASIESAAFHESFGDMSAILSALQLDTLAQAVLDETGGRLYRSTLLSRLAEELGWAIRQINSQAVDPDCLRNAVNSFFYRDPATLPPAAPASLLSSAPHSFSRVFTAAFYDALAGMVQTDNPTPTVQSLRRVTRDAGQLLIDGVRSAPVVPNYFSQVAAQMIAADETRFGRKYRDILKGAFVRHGVLSLEAAAAIVGPPVPVSPVAAAAGIVEIVGAGDGANLLPPVAVPAASLGLNSATILCEAPGEVGGYAIAAAAALDTGSLVPPSHIDAARFFLEDLFRLGRVDVGEHGNPDTRISQPTVRKTHTLQSTNAGPMLVRETFDCGFD